MINYKLLQQKLGHVFKDESLLICALTHRSTQQSENNERLEFLGDAVLSLIISTELFSKYAHFREGELSRMRAALVKGETIAKIAAALGIGKVLRLGVGELKSGGKLRESILAGAFESVIGAIYCDSNYECVKNHVLQWYRQYNDKIDFTLDAKDPKTILQELMQAQKRDLPIYTAQITGEAHQQTFDVTCCVRGFDFATKGVSSNRKKAEQIAAKQFLERIHGK